MDLADTALMQGVTAAAVVRLRQAGIEHALAQDALVCVAGEPEVPVIFVLDGALRVFKSDAEGREQTVIVCTAGQVINLPVAFGADTRAPANVQILSPQATLFSVPRQAFVETVIRDPALALAVMRTLASLARHLNDLVTDLSLRSVRQRLARFLLEQMATAATPSRWTHVEIATRLGTAREVISRQMRALIDEGVLRQERQRLVINDLDALRRIAEE